MPTLGRWARKRHLLKTASQLRRAGVWPAFRRMMRTGRDRPGPALFAPDCIEKDGRYYLYFDLSDESEGMAVSDRPEGPFRDPVRLPATGIDPAVFVDDDGAAYYFWGQFRAAGVRLADDMRSFEPQAVTRDMVTEEEHHFHEGSSMRRIGETDYFVFADTSRGMPTRLGYATASNPSAPSPTAASSSTTTGATRRRGTTTGRSSRSAASGTSSTTVPATTRPPDVGSASNRSSSPPTDPSPRCR